MTPPPFVNDRQRQQDSEHLRLLAIFHFIFAFFALAGIGFLALHYLVFSTVFANPEMWKNSPNAKPPPPELFQLLIWFYIFFGVILIVDGLLNLLSGLGLLKKKNRTFSIVVAGLNCMQLPFGTILGVFTLVVLLRESVRQLYAEPDVK